MTTESIRVARRITDGSMDHAITISNLLKISNDLIVEATDLVSTINQLQGRSSVKIDKPDPIKGFSYVPDDFRKDTRVTTRMLNEQYQEYQEVYNALLEVAVEVAL